MLRYLKEREAAERIERALMKVFEKQCEDTRHRRQRENDGIRDAVIAAME
jgi:isocitrate/isopropylmalate dehydrogenase